MTATIIPLHKPKNKAVDGILAELNVATNWEAEPASPMQQARDCVQVLENLGKELTWKVELAEAALRSLNSAMDNMQPAQRQRIIADAGAESALSLVVLVAAQKAGEFEVALAEAQVG